MVKQLIYKTGDVTVEGKELTETPGGKIRLQNQQDYMELMNYSMSLLIAAISELNEAIDDLRSDIRQIKVGNEAFVYGEKVDESADIDQEELEHA